MNNKTAGSTKHTPGDWRVVPIRKGLNYWIYQVSANEDAPFGEPRFNCLFEREADARLVASGPDLLKAAKAVLAWDKINTSIAINTEGCEVVSMLRAAIAKAEGR